MRRLLLPLAVVAVVSMLRPLAAPPAAACSCVAPPSDEDQIKKYLGYFDAAVIGTARPAPPGAAYPDKVYIAVLRSFKGPSVSLIPSSQPLGRSPDHDGPTGMCGYTLAEKSRTRHFLALTAEPDGTYSPSGCGSFPMTGNVEFLLALEGLTNAAPPAAPPAVTVAAATSGDDGSPWLSIALASAIGGVSGLAVLAASLALMRRMSTRSRSNR